ncbi:MAG: hypothetical protein I8H94_05815 [Rhodobacteraceae bacterium]|nr:hypothetical protein [Paracoccaceae bacterium]
MNGVTYVVNAPLSMPKDELGKLIALNMPMGVSNLVSASLGTEKLERQLSEPSLGSESEPLIYDFFKAALIADLRLPTAPDAIRVFFERARGSRYLAEALIWKMRELRRLNKIEEGQFSRITPYLAGAIADLRGGDKSTRDTEKSKEIQKLKRRGLVLKLARRNSQEED